MLLSTLKALLDQYDPINQIDINRIRAVYDAEVQKGQAQLSFDAEVELFQCLCLSSCERGSDAWRVVDNLWNALELPRYDGTSSFYHSFYFMNQKEMLGLSNRWKQLFNKKEYLSSILDAIHALLGPFDCGKYQRQHLLTPDNFNAIVEAKAYMHDVTQALLTLNNAQLLTPNNRQAIIEAKAHAEGVAFALRDLNDTDLLTTENRQAIIEANAHAYSVASALRTLNDAHLLTTENRQTIVLASAHTGDVARALFILNDAHLLTQDNFNAIVLAAEHAYSVASALYALNDASLLTQDNFNALIQHAECFDHRPIKRLWGNIPAHLFTQPFFNQLIQFATLENQATARLNIVRHMEALLAQPEPEQPAPTQRRINYGQSVHNAYVESSARESADKLYETYQAVITNPSKRHEAIHALQTFQKTLKDTPAARALQTMLNEGADIRKGNDEKYRFTLLDTLLLVWVGLNDHQAHSADTVLMAQALLIERHSKDKKMSEEERATLLQDLMNDPHYPALLNQAHDQLVKDRFIEKLDDIQRSYNKDEEGKDNGREDERMCSNGRFNPLLDSLNTIHPAVNMIFKNAESAGLKLQAIIKQLVGEYLKEHTKEDLKSILDKLQEGGLSAILSQSDLSQFEAKITTRFNEEFETFPDVLSAWRDVDITAVIQHYRRLLESPQPVLSSHSRPSSPRPSVTGLFAPPAVEERTSLSQIYSNIVGVEPGYV